MHPINWWSVAGIVSDIIGVLGVGLDSYIWTRAAPIDVFPKTPAPTRFGFEVPRPLYRRRMLAFWSLIVAGFVLQLVGQLR